MQLVVRDATAAGSAAGQATAVLAAPLVKQLVAEGEVVVERLSIAEAGRRVAARFTMAEGGRLLITPTGFTIGDGREIRDGDAGSRRLPADVGRSKA